MADKAKHPPPDENLNVDRYGDESLEFVSIEQDPPEMREDFDAEENKA